MNKYFKIIIIFLTVCFYNCQGLSDHSPDSLLKRAYLELSEYSIESQDDNLDRSQSAWDYYTYNIRVPEHLENSLTLKMNELVKTNNLWTYDEEDGLYIFHEEKDEDYELSIYVDLNSMTIYIHYMEYDWLA